MNKRLKTHFNLITVYILCVHSLSKLKADFLDDDCGQNHPIPGSDCDKDMKETNNKFSNVIGYPLYAKCTNIFLVCSGYPSKWGYVSSEDLLSKAEEDQNQALKNLYSSLNYLIENCINDEAPIWCKYEYIVYGAPECTDLNDPDNFCKTNDNLNCDDMDEIIDIETKLTWQDIIESEVYSEDYVSPTFKMKILNNE
ncbi:MAG: hypothetical protein MHPSP_001768 [Paramarteilia canceri]